MLNQFAGNTHCESGGGWQIMAAAHRKQKRTTKQLKEVQRRTLEMDVENEKMKKQIMSRRVEMATIQKMMNMDNDVVTVQKRPRRQISSSITSSQTKPSPL